VRTFDVTFRAIARVAASRGFSAAAELVVGVVLCTKLHYTAVVMCRPDGRRHRIRRAWYLRRDVRLRVRSVLSAVSLFHLSVSFVLSVLQTFRCVLQCTMTPTRRQRNKSSLLDCSNCQRYPSFFGNLGLFLHYPRDVVSARYILRQRGWVAGWLAVHDTPVLYQNG